jgi:mono/diheme cytochrome c family protein
MLNSKTALLSVVSILGLVSVHTDRAPRLFAQEKPAATSSTSAKLIDRKLSEQQTRGEGLFLQRCSICHLPRKLKFGSPATAGPNLSGLIKNAGPEDMKVLRGIILKGSPNMPGFQYGLETKQIDDLMAFLTTL